MKYAIAASAALFTGNAFAHSGHTQRVDGHTHSLIDLAQMGAMPVLIGLAVIGLFLIVKRNND